MGNNGDPSAHFHVQNDCSGPDDNCPQQLIAEVCAGLRGKDHLTKVEEAAQGGHDTQRDA